LLHDELGRILEKLAKTISERTKSDGREEVDGVSGITHVIAREHSLVPFSLFRICSLKTSFQLGDSNGFDDFVHQDLDEDTAGARRLVFVEVDDGQNAPGNRVRVKQMSKQLCNISKLVSLESVNGVVLRGKRFNECIPPAIIQETKSS
jgi:hypothetical protein